MHVKGNPDFSNLQGKRELVRKIGDFEKSKVKVQRWTEEGKRLLGGSRNLDFTQFDHVQLLESTIYRSSAPCPTQLCHLEKRRFLYSLVK